MKKLETHKQQSTKQLAPSFVTGGGGFHFEAQVGAVFAILMLEGKGAPFLHRGPVGPIEEIRLQTEHNTDDIKVVCKEPKRNLLVEVKSTVHITKDDAVFSKVIKAAWKDFNDPKFKKEQDGIALITGPLNRTDTDHVFTLLEWAKTTNNAQEFLFRVKQEKVSSEEKREKLKVFRHHLKKANEDKEISDENLYAFLRHFYLDGLNLQREGILRKLLSPTPQQNVFGILVDFVQHYNKNAGTITREAIPEDIKKCFPDYNKQEEQKLPAFQPLRSSNEQDWKDSQYASDLVIANLIGGWNEKNKDDLEIVKKLAEKPYEKWICGIREVLNGPSSPVGLKDGKWSVTERKHLWQNLGKKVFDNHLDDFKHCVVTVLSERDPKFELPPQDRFAASIYGKVFKYSLKLRRGLSETLALLSTCSSDMKHCTLHKPENTAFSAVQEIFKNADWVLWASLDNLLPTLAEAAPDTFLTTVESALQQTSCPFDKLLHQKTDGYSLECCNRYNTGGLFYALEALAWDKDLFVRVCTILSEFASRASGGTDMDGAINSLWNILNLNYPKPIVPIKKREATLKTLKKDFPEVAYNLLLKLLPAPGVFQIIVHAYKPRWRDTFPKDWKEDGGNKEYSEQVLLYAKLAVEMARSDIKKLTDFIDSLDPLHNPSLFNEILEHLSSDEIAKSPENQGFELWKRLTLFTLHFSRRFPNNKEIVSQLESVVQRLAPENPLYRHRLLFIHNHYDLFQGQQESDFEKKQKEIRKKQEEAVEDLLKYGGMKAILEFFQTVEEPDRVGSALGAIAGAEIDEQILPAMLKTNSENLKLFTEGYVWERKYKNGWEWVDSLNRSDWTPLQMTRFLIDLPFEEGTWQRATDWLGQSERKYWSKAIVNPYPAKNLKVAIDRLIKYKRPEDAIKCLTVMLHKGKPLDKTQSIKALLAVASLEKSVKRLNISEVIELVKALQEDHETDHKVLLRLEFAYASWLPSLKTLGNSLASDPGFFCKMLGYVYHSKKESSSKKPLSKHDQDLAFNVREILLEKWKTPPGTQPDGRFSPCQFKDWLKQVKDTCHKTGRLEVALYVIGSVLIHSPQDPNGGLWIHHTVAEALNDKDVNRMREGYSIATFNSRGAHVVDPTGKPEQKLSEQYNEKAEAVEKAGCQRFATTLRGIALDYKKDAERVIRECGQ